MASKTTHKKRKQHKLASPGIKLISNLMAKSEDSTDELARTPPRTTRAAKRPKRSRSPSEPAREHLSGPAVVDAQLSRDTSPAKNGSKPHNDVQTSPLSNDRYAGSIEEDERVVSDDAQPDCQPQMVEQDQLMLDEEHEYAKPEDSHSQNEPSKPPAPSRQGTRRTPRLSRKSLATKEDLNKESSDHSTQGTASKKRTPATKNKKATTSALIRYTKKWDPALVVTDSKSPMVKAKLIDILRSEDAWSALTPAQQRELLTYLPPAPSQAMRELEQAMVEAIAEGEALPNVALMRLDASMAFKADVRQFQEELGLGKLDIGWIEQAMRASARRKAGDFDDWKVKERENKWAMNGVDDGS